MAASSWLLGGLIVFGVVDVVALDLVIGPRALDAPRVARTEIAAAIVRPPAPAPAPVSPTPVPVPEPVTPPVPPPPAAPPPAPVEHPVVVLRFATDHDRLDAAAARALDGVAAELAAAPGDEVEIVGHADARGTEHHNEELSARRMAHVRDYLAAHGVAHARLHGRAAGDREPALPGDDEAALAANRRVEIRRTP